MIDVDDLYLLYSLAGMHGLGWNVLYCIVTQKSFHSIMRERANVLLQQAYIPRLPSPTHCSV